MAHSHHRHPVIGTRHPHHAEHVHVHDKVMQHEHDRRHPDHPLSFHYPQDHESAVLPEHGSHTQGQQGRQEAIIERGRANHPSYVRAYREHGARMKGWSR